MSDRRGASGPFFGWEGLVTVRGVLEITDKLDEAKFLLRLMRDQEKLAEFRWLTSACLNACRSALDWLGWNAHFGCEDEEAGRVPDDNVIRHLEKYMRVFSSRRRNGRLQVRVSPVHPLLEEMSDRRQETAHRSSLWIDRLPDVSPEKMLQPGDQFAFVETREAEKFDFVLRIAPGRRVCEFCDEVIQLIESISEEIRFAETSSEE